MPHTPFPTNKKKETAVLIGVSVFGQLEDRTEEYLDELEFLAETAGAVTKKRFIQKLSHPDPKTFLGSGKLIEIRDYIKENTIDLAIFDDELSGSQIRNIEKTLECRILDRTNL